MPCQRVIQWGYPGAFAIADNGRLVGMRMAWVRQHGVARLLLDGKVLPFKGQDLLVPVGMQSIGLGARGGGQLEVVGVGAQVRVPQARFAVVRADRMKALEKRPDFPRQCLA